ncbi:PX domain containing protein [Histomonas meleagridis]|uniref:PX domain containing protein n=1 Tax=Histomonas meleagridis TaxID=135588 RepID=UPI00355A47B1|nr:PX domain containing protein [Histomonas meleagridis]KAH0803551.1 PX domain containing protein [Histomonas meleagridis]
MNLDQQTVNSMIEAQLASCEGQEKITLIITGHQDDAAAAKATFFNIQAKKYDTNGSVVKTSEERYRYSQLLDFNESLILDYGNIRILRLFPPKKWVGNKSTDFVTQRQEALQKWLNELVEDEETSSDPKILRFFKLIE